MSFDSRVSRTLKNVAQGRKTGALVSQSGSVKRMLYFESGLLTGCRSSLADERLGELMVREGRIDEAQLRTTVEHIRTGRKMGQIMVELGYLKGGEIEAYVRLQILEVATRMLLGQSDRLLFSEEIPVEGATLSPVTVAQVFVTASRQLEDAESYREKILADELVLIRAPHPPVPEDKLALSAEELAVSTLIDSRTTAGEILRASPVPADRALRALVGLLHAGLIERAPARTAPLDEPSADAEDAEERLAEIYRQVQGQNHWTVLGLEPGADYRCVEQAYAELRNELGSDAFGAVPDEDLQEKLSFIQARVKNAFLTLSAQSQASAYGRLVAREREYQQQREDWDAPASDAPPLAKDSKKAATIFRRAREAFRAKDYWSAIQLARAAIELNEEQNGDHYQLLGAALAHNPRWRDDAEKHLKIATQIDPWKATYLVTLAKFYQREGQVRRARQLLEQARAVEPEHPIPELES